MQLSSWHCSSVEELRVHEAYLKADLTCRGQPLDQIATRGADALNDRPPPLALIALSSLAFGAHCPLGRTAAQHCRPLLNCCDVLCDLRGGSTLSDCRALALGFFKSTFAHLSCSLAMNAFRQLAFHLCAAVKERSLLPEQSPGCSCCALAYQEIGSDAA